ncbi:hypothetical protein [Nonomuraea roseola]|uniref:Uncharacterized protein n=1 Tax=Nonomuraea roseola TaxID=46179 RepID=A0ABV5PZI5_9ACTN
MWEIYQSNPQGFMPYFRGEKNLLPLLYLPPPLVMKTNLSPWIDQSLLVFMLLILFWALGPHGPLKVIVYLLVVFGIAVAAPVSRVFVFAAMDSTAAWWVRTAWPWLADAAVSPWTKAVLGLLLAAGCLMAFLFTCYACVRVAGELVADEMGLPDVARCLALALVGACALGIIVELAAWSVHLMGNTYAFPGWQPFLWTVFVAGLAATTAVAADVTSGSASEEPESPQT